MNPIKLELNDVFSYQHLVLNMDELQFVLIQGVNGSGKTRIFSALCWVLFGEIPEKNYKQIIRDVPIKQKSCSGSFIFRHESIDSEYEIIRTKIGSSPPSVKLIENGIESELRTASMIQEKINDILGMDMKTFLNIAYFSQGDIGKFLNTSGDRIEIISRIAGNDKIDKVLKLVNKDVEKYNSELNKKLGEMSVLERIVTSLDISDINRQLKVKKQQVKQLTDKINVNSEYIDKANEKNKKRKEIDEFRKEIESEKRVFRSIHEELIKNYKEIKVKIDDCEKKIDELQSKYPDIEDELKKQLSDLKNNQIQLSKLENENGKISAKISSSKSEINELNSIIEMEGGQCPVCLSEIKPRHVEVIKKLILRIKGEIVSNQKKYSDLIEKIKYVSGVISDGESEYEKNRKINQELINLKNYKVNNSKQLAIIKKKGEDNKKYSVELLNPMEKQLQKMEKEYSLLDVDDSKYEMIESLIEKDKDDLSKIKFDIETLFVDKEKYEKSYKELKKIEYEIGDKQIQMAVANFWKVSLPKIKVKAIGDIIPVLEGLTNDYLSRILPNKTVEFKSNIEQSTNKLDVIIRDEYHNIKRVFTGWSGGEGDRITMSIFLGLNKLASMKSGKKINFLILDEKFASLDIEARKSVIDMLKDEYQNRKLFVISHIGDIESEFSEVIKVTKKNDVSSIHLRKQ